MRYQDLHTGEKFYFPDQGIIPVIWVKATDTTAKSNGSINVQKINVRPNWEVVKL